MQIPQATIDAIKDRIDVVDVIGDFVDLKKAGQTYKALSPFTDEKTPSFYVVPTKGIFKCFSSGKGGDAINFIMEYDGLNYVEALKYLAEKYGIEIKEKELSNEELQAQNERDSLFIATSFAKEYYQKQLQSEEGKAIGLSYFEERGLKTSDIEKFGLGYSLEERDSFMQEAIKKGFSKNILEKAGLINVQAGKEYDRFRGRVMFPIHNQTGKVIAFGARTLKKEKKIPKYVNSPETDIYSKSKVLYGLHLAKGPIRKEDNCYLVEGYTDVIALHHFGIENVVSSSGTALTVDQIGLLGRFSHQVTVLFDGDAAGLRASLRGIDLLLEGGLNVSCVILPEGQDPDSYSRELGSYEFKKFLEENAQDFIRFKISLFVEDAKKDPIKKAESIKDIVESISKIPDSIKRAVYVKEAGELLELDESVLVAELNKHLIKSRRQELKKKTENQVVELQPDTTPESTVTDRIEESLRRQERETIRSLLKYGMEKVDGDILLYEYLFNELEEVKFTYPVYDEIFRSFRDSVTTTNDFDIKSLIETNNADVKSEVIGMITEKYELSKLWKDRFKIHVMQEEEMLLDKAFSDLLRLKLSNIKKMIRTNLELIKSTGDSSRIDEIQQKHQVLKKSEKEITDILGIVVPG